MIAQDIMTKDLVTVTETASIAEALRALSEAGVRHLPVVRGGDVVGMLSDRDFTSLGLALVNDEEHFEQLRVKLTRPVAALMTSAVVSVSRDADVSEIVELMLEEKLSALPVVEGGTLELAGIVSYIDVLRAAQELFEVA